MILHRRQKENIDQNIAQHTPSVLREAVAIFQQYESAHTTQKEPYRWVCEGCGMPHSGKAPLACESCGRTDALVSDYYLPTEMFRRW
jgi:rubrerythrin